MTVAEEIVITGVEQLWIFAHEPAERGIVRSGAVFIEGERRDVGPSIGGSVFPAREQKTIVENGPGTGSDSARRAVDSSGPARAGTATPRGLCEQRPARRELLLAGPA